MIIVSLCVSCMSLELLLFIIAIYSNVHVAFDNDLLTYELLGADFAIFVFFFFRFAIFFIVHVSLLFVV